MVGNLVFHSGTSLSLGTWSVPPPAPLAPSHGVHANGSGWLITHRRIGVPDPWGEIIQGQRLFRLNSYSFPAYADTDASRLADRGNKRVAIVCWEHQANVWRIVFCSQNPSTSRLNSFGGYDAWWSYVIGKIIQYGANAVWHTGNLSDIPDAYEARRLGGLFGPYTYHNFDTTDASVDGHVVSNVSVSEMPDGGVAEGTEDPEDYEDPYKLDVEDFLDPPDPLPGDDFDPYDVGLNPDEEGENDPPKDPGEEDP
jgi:hypothetical protein